MGIDCSSIHTTEVLRMQLCGLNQEDDQVMRYGRLLAVGVVKTHTNILSIGMISIDETKVDIGNNNIMPVGSNSAMKLTESTDTTKSNQSILSVHTTVSTDITESGESMEEANLEDLEVNLEDLEVNLEKEANLDDEAGVNSEKVEEVTLEAGVNSEKVEEVNLEAGENSETGVNLEKVLTTEEKARENTKALYSRKVVIVLASIVLVLLSNFVLAMMSKHKQIKDSVVDSEDTNRLITT